MSLLNNDEKGIGLEKINRIFENLKKDLNRIGAIENTIEKSSIFISSDQSYSTYDELELVVNSEIGAFSKSNRILSTFKWMLIIFESLSGYLAIGLLTHAIINFDSLDTWAIVTIRMTLAIALSYAIVNFAMYIIRPESNSTNNISNSIIAFGTIIALPVLNLVMIYKASFAVDYKEIYIISLFFTAITGSFLVSSSKRWSLQKEREIQRIKEIKKLLLERKNTYDKSRAKYIDIFSENNKYDEVISYSDVGGKTVYSGLLSFLTECKDFDVWSIKYITNVKNQQQKLSIKKNIDNNALDEQTS